MNLLPTNIHENHTAVNAVQISLTDFMQSAADDYRISQFATSIRRSRTFSTIEAWNAGTDGPSGTPDVN